MALHAFAFLLASCFGLGAFGQNIPAAYKQYEGMTFAVPGPNCFASALKISGITRSFRGMDEPEFRAITKIFCEEVKTPKAGDIGVFEIKGFGFIHAFVYLSDESGMQKPGVDYAGKTAISVQSLESIDYIYKTSPECRRYSKDISKCSNDRYFLRCRPIDLAKNPTLADHESRVARLEEKMDGLLRSASFPLTESEKIILRGIESDMKDLALNLRGKKILPLEISRFISARMVSLSKQIAFLRARL